ncbi:hypothetical protein AAFF_G00062160 [Aldrovandia affinis]|uniref:Uncharacterized protein n=1 Tax=Aldrovandia affinis TaxID=143900 RepID=A0AAD7WE64_9TELE|nr:hypothetical protein AAFF_G00062160 [Aldrovandia affinis]
MTVQDLSHRQMPQSTSPVEVAYRCRRTISTHPAPPDPNGHPRGRHHLPTRQPRVQGPEVQSLRTPDQRRALTTEPCHCLVGRGPNVHLGHKCVSAIKCLKNPTR